MTISYPISMPTGSGLASIMIRRRAAVGFSESPFTLTPQVFPHQGQAWGLSVRVMKLTRADAAEWIGRLVSLNGMQGTFLQGDPAGTAPRGTWTTPDVDGSHAARVLVVAMKNMGGAGSTWKIGDWLQFGSGSSAHLHMVTADGAADGSGNGSIDIWPATREALANNDPVTLLNTVGHWRLAANDQDWSIDEAIRYGIEFHALEAGLA